MKCVRLLKHLNLKDNLSTFDTSSGSILTTGSSSEDSVWTGAVQSFSSLGSSSETMDQQISGSSSFGSFDTVSNSKKKSRMKVCTDFLTLIDESNTILDTFHSHEFVDQIKLSRNIVSTLFCFPFLSLFLLDFFSISEFSPSKTEREE